LKTVIYRINHSWL